MSLGTTMYEQSIVIDACAPLACPYEGEFTLYQHYVKGRQTMVAGTILPLNSYLPQAIESITNYYKIFRADPNVRQILTVNDIYEAKKKGQLGIMVAFQGCSYL